MTTPTTTSRSLDLTQGEFIEIQAGELVIKLYDTVNLLVKEKSATLDQIKAALDGDLDLSIVIAVDTLAGNKSFGRKADIADLLKRTAALVTREGRLMVFANTLATISPRTTVKLTLEQAEEFGY